jgi:uncharacterized delta-60 repeat protein
VRAGEATRAILQADGKLVVVGTTSPYDPFFPPLFPDITPADADFLIARYNMDGTPDKTFAGTGLLRLDFNGGSDFAGALAQQPDGKLVVGGSATNAAGKVGAAAVRLNTDGTLDTTFNSTGKIIYDSVTATYDWGGATVTLNPPGAFTFTDIFVLSEGRLLFAAKPYQVVSSPHGSGVGVGVLVRTSSEGQLDASYGQGKTGWDNSSLYLLAQQPDGSFIAVEPSGQDSILLRYDANGVIDSTFGALRLPLAPGSAVTAPLALAVRPNAGILVAGGNGTLSQSLGLVTSTAFVTQASPQPQIDTSFGTGGSDLGYQGDFDNLTYSMALEPSGKVLLAGIAGRTADINSPQDLSVVRLGEHGTVDSTFAPNGRVILDLSEGSTTYSSTPVDLLRRKDGHLVIVANRGNLSTGSFLRGSLLPAGQQIVIEQVISTPQFALSTATATVAANETSAVLTVTRTGKPDGPVSVDYATTGSTTTQGTLTWQPGDADNKTITVSVDASRQAQQQFTVVLDNPNEGTVTGGPTVVTVAAGGTTPTSGGKGGGGGALDVLLLALLTFGYAWRARRPLKA